MALPALPQSGASGRDDRGRRMSAPVATIRKNGSEELRVSVDDFKGHRLVNLRVWYRTGDGEMRPGKQGLALRLELLPELRAALEKAGSS